MKPLFNRSSKSSGSLAPDALHYILPAFFLVILGGVMALGFFARKSNHAYAKTSGQIELTNRILSETSILGTLDEDNETETRNYLLTNNGSILAHSQQREKEIIRHLDKLKESTRNVPELSASAVMLEGSILSKMKILDSAVALQKAGQGEAAMAVIVGDEGQRAIEGASTAIANIESSQRGYLDREKQVGAKTVSNLDLTIWLLMIVPTLLLGGSLAAIRHAFSSKRKREEEITELNSTLERRVVQRTEELDRSEKRYRHLFESNPLPMWVIDSGTSIFLDVNEAAIRSYGYTRKEFLAMSALCIRPEEEREKFIGLVRSDKAGTRNGETWKHLKKDGTVIYAEVHANEILFEGARAWLILSNDVTQRKVAEQRLEATNTELNRLFNTIDEVIYSVDMFNSRITQMSPACEKIYGYTSGDFFADFDLWNKITHPDDSDKILGHFPHLVAGEQVTDQCRIIHKDGSVRWVEYHMIPALDNLGRLMRIDGVVKDITGKKLAEGELAKAHQELNKLFSSVDQVLFSVDTTSYELIQISPACAKVYGYPPSFFFANPDLWKDVICKDDVGFMETNQPLLSAGETVSSQYRIMHRTQGLRWIETTVTPTLDEEGRMVRLDGVTTDIHEKKTAEAALIKSKANLRAILDNTDTSYILFDTDFNIVSFNEPAYARSKPELGQYFEVGKNFISMLMDKDKETTVAMMSAALAGQKVTYEYEYYNVDERLTWYQVDIHAIRDKEQRVIGLCLAADDITERKRLDDEIKMLNESLERKVMERTKQLQTANEELESFSYSVSHDLRAPLRIINGYGSILLGSCSEKLDAEEREYVDSMMSTAHHMGELIDDLLEFSRVGRAALDKKKVDMDDMVGVVLKELNIGNEDCAALVVQKELGISEGDPRLMRQVWINLISNALKYSAKKDKPVIEIGAMSGDGETTYYVKDNGAGFDMRHADKLFAVFQRLHKVTEYEGTGVGLALAHRIVTKHGGRIWAEGRVNKGATFYFTLPIRITKSLAYESQH